ncbi:hypothetical protein AVEN_203228-1 [Araneus ventricosus]|uniref:Uncharacterized protein n=1 Tax=Araneus ventricosus TaxID=182803 RepID=A0A4Y2F4M1_ARAVE|nr:hypothetical protein AVEN_203228-1 [Araneus ventricosus]
MATLLYPDTKFVAIVVAVLKLMWGTRTLVDTQCVITVCTQSVNGKGPNAYSILFPIIRSLTQNAPYCPCVQRITLVLVCLQEHLRPYSSNNITVKRDDKSCNLG